MQVAIIHYHLNRGGVTQVIVNHLRSLGAAGQSGDTLRLALLYGGRHDGWSKEQLSSAGELGARLAEVPGIDYEEGSAPKSAELAAALRRTLGDMGLSPDETILHVHNHALGKNVSLPGALTALAEDGYAQLLQIHDFPEDFRPHNYRQLAAALTPDDAEQLPGVLYPQASHIHYAVLNRRDHSILREAGVAESRLHLLPNPVADLGTLPSKEAARAKLAQAFGIPEQSLFALYPVRGIRRKNLGEAILWSALGGDRARFGLTLSPLNPLERASYRRWHTVAKSLGLPFAFELGARGGLRFSENLAAADLLLTTSVAEGFGMVFLESCLAGRRLVGRDLPEITGDFAAQGIQLDHLSPRMATPLAWVGEGVLRDALSGSYASALAAYQRPALSAEELDHEMHKLIWQDQVDFAVLNGTIQRQVVSDIRSEPGRREQMLELNPEVRRALDPANGTELLHRNAEAVRRAYCLERSGQRLLEVYRQVAASRRTDAASPPAQGRRVLDAFLQLSRFHPIRTET